jgi:hypothetical protein
MTKRTGTQALSLAILPLPKTYRDTVRGRLQSKIEVFECEDKAKERQAARRSPAHQHQLLANIFFDNILVIKFRFSSLVKMLLGFGTCRLQ